MWCFTFCTVQCLCVFVLERGTCNLRVKSLAHERNVMTQCSKAASRPFKVKTKAVIIRQPHKIKTASFFCPVSGCGLPQLYAVLEAGYVQIDVGQEHVTCLSLLAELSQQFTSPPAVKKQAEVGAESSDQSREVPEQVVLYQSFDDIRAGCFRYVTASGNAIFRKMIWLWSGIEQFEGFLAFVPPLSRKSATSGVVHLHFLNLRWHSY